MAINSEIICHPLRGQRLIDYLATRNRIHYNPGSVSNIARNHPPFLYRMNLMKKLPVHDGCVNTICWNRTGEYLLSGSDDSNLCITKPTYLFDQSKDYTVLHKLPTRHIGNIFSAQFLANSNDSIIVSCSKDGPVIVHDINSNDSPDIFSYSCHSATIFEVVPLQDEDKVFLSCSEDKTVRLFDLRCHRSCIRADTCPHPALIRNSHAMTTLSVHPLNSNILMVGRADGIGLIYDRRKLPDPSKFSRENAHIEYLARQEGRGGTMSEESYTCKYMHPLDGVVSQVIVPDMEKRFRFTSLCFSSSGDQILASYSQDYVYLFDLDASANVELVQTLPRKAVSNEPDDNSETTNSNQSLNLGESDRGAMPPPPPYNLPRIRVRGDWSGTGVNSVPYSSRLSNSNSSNVRSIPNFLQRMTEIASNLHEQRAGVGPRFPPMTEMIAGPIEFSLSSQNESDRSPNRADIEESDTEDEEESSDRDDDDQDEEEEEEADGEDEMVGIRVTRADSGVLSSRNVTTRKRNDVINKPKISPQMKTKFQKTIAGLKDKYGKIPTHHPQFKYQGHRNSRTSINQAVFWGDDYIMSGSDCGRIMIWEKKSAKLVMAIPADERVVNCLAPNPHYYALASSGIDYDIKLWSTQNILDCPLRVSQAELDKIMKNNELMLEEAKQTITVPPHLFFRVLASLAHDRLNPVFS